MRANDVKKVLRTEPFEPIKLALSDGRSVLVRHPDQIVVAERHVIVGLAQVEGSRPLTTPANSDAIAKDWMILNLLHISAIEPVRGNGGRKK